jgi:hypothetical protein
VETSWHDHSLESSWGPLYGDTISLSIKPFLGVKCIFLNFSQKPQSWNLWLLPKGLTHKNMKWVKSSLESPLVETSPLRTPNSSPKLVISIHFHLCNQDTSQFMYSSFQSQWCSWVVLLYVLINLI